MENLNQKSLNAALWAAADELRKTMSADVYKDYLLPLVFYKNLSDRMLYEASDLSLIHIYVTFKLKEKIRENDKLYILKSVVNEEL